MNSIRWPLALLALSVLSACNQNAAPAQPAATAQPEASAVSEAAPASTARPAASDAPYALTMDHVDAYFEAQKRLVLAAKADPTLEDLSMNVSHEDSTQYAARLEANPKVRAAIADAGLSTRDFALTGETLISALMAQAALEGGMLKEIPKGLDPASVDFVKQNKAKIEAAMRSSADSSQ